MTSESDTVHQPLTGAVLEDGITEDDQERRDDVAVLTSEGGLFADEILEDKRKHYTVRPSLKRCFHVCRWRQGAVLILGIFLTVVALTLVVVGAVKSRQHRTYKLLHIKQAIDPKSHVSLKEENFSFAQLLGLSNLALDKPCYQSSYSTRNKTENMEESAALAVDGDISTCAVTGLERSPYLWVGLQRTKSIRAVRILGRRLSKLHDLYIYVSNNKTTNSANDLCGAFHGKGSSLEVRVECKSTASGRYVTIRLQTQEDTYERLVICEVMVFK